MSDQPYQGRFNSVSVRVKTLVDHWEMVCPICQKKIEREENGSEFYFCLIFNVFKEITTIQTAQSA